MPLFLGSAGVCPPFTTDLSSFPVLYCFGSHLSPMSGSQLTQALRQGARDCPLPRSLSLSLSHTHTHPAPSLWAQPLGHLRLRSCQSCPDGRSYCLTSTPTPPLTSLVPACLCPSVGCWQFPHVAQGPSWSWGLALSGWFHSSCACPQFSVGTLGWQQVRVHLFCLEQRGSGCWDLPGPCPNHFPSPEMYV